MTTHLAPFGAVAPVRPFRRARIASPPDARDIIGQGIAAQFIARIRGRSVDQIVAEKFGGNGLILKAAVNPAMTNVIDWAGELTAPAIGPFMALAPQSAYAQLAQRGTRVSFGQGGNVVLPQDTLTTPVSSLFVGEGDPIPVTKGNLAAALLQPRKASAITAWTREMAKATPLSIAAVFSRLLENYIAFRADQVLLSGGAAAGAQPAGIHNGVEALTASTSGAPLDRMVADMRNLVAALTEDAPPIQPVFIMSPANKVAVELLSPGHGLDIIDSAVLAYGSANTVMCVDAASFASGEGDQAYIDIGEAATLHMDDETPLPVVDDAGAAAAPVRSLWQTASVGLRVIHSLDWTMRRAGRVAWLKEQWFAT